MAIISPLQDEEVHTLAQHIMARIRFQHQIVFGAQAMECPPVQHKYHFQIDELAAWLNQPTAKVRAGIAELCARLSHVQVHHYVDNSPHFDFAVLFSRVGYSEQGVSVALNTELADNVWWMTAPTA
ncbi:hypothetical protein BZJ17_12310 [Salinivibrio sp. IB574]|uniref:hypothetical protein n=1 Tax=Salinivibrio sp. IB574 TaxID=1909444 RepID=UPI00098931BD|nr:hypothetical protein [Salinivibrio sp. IB574]OOF20681.1 hypothetical protein BZJ17_12310 [Salinivibrio sp. IB574]